MKINRVWVGVGFVCLLGLSCGGEASASGTRAAVVAPEVDRESESPKLALEAAREKKQRMEDARGKHRRSLRRQAVKAYQAVARRFPNSGPVAAEASFRAGELLRIQGDDKAALVELSRAMETVRGGVFTSRASYESAQIKRRTGDFEAALQLFLQTESNRSADSHRRDLATFWRAKTRIEMGQIDEAERQLRALVKRATDPIDRLRSYDELILILVRSGRLAAAVGHFANAKRSVWRESLEKTERGNRVRKTLDGLRSLDAMRKAIAASR